MIIFCPKYINYTKRAIFYIKKRVLLICIIPFIFLLIKGIGTYFLYSLIFVLVFTFISFINSLYINLYYLDKIEINDIANKIILTIRKKNKVFNVQEYDISKIYIDVVKVWYSKYPRYYLQVKQNGYKLIRQHCVGEWDTKLFIEVLQKINKLKGKETYTNYIKTK